MDIDVFDEQPLNRDALGPGARIPHRAALQPRRGQARGEADRSTSARGRRTSASATRCTILFECEPAVRGEAGGPRRRRQADDRAVRHSATRRAASIRRASRRLAPDFFFHDQIYRQPTAKTVAAAAGRVRGHLQPRAGVPRTRRRTITVPGDGREHTRVVPPQALDQAGRLRLVLGRPPRPRRRLRPLRSARPKASRPADMMRHILGEDLNVGCVLSWGPCWYHQKQFFEGDGPQALDEGLPDAVRRRGLRLPQPARRAPLPAAAEGGRLRVSQAGRSSTGRSAASDGQFKGTQDRADRRVADLGPADPASGARSRAASSASRTAAGALPKVRRTVDARLPDSCRLCMPPFDGIGANEFVVDTVHGVCDFISAVDTPAVWELNIWYHTLNCGMTTRISGETDFPCIYGERVGLGRGYVKLGAAEQQTAAARLRRLGRRHPRRPQLLLRRPVAPGRFHGQRPGRRREPRRANRRTANRRDAVPCSPAAKPTRLAKTSRWRSRATS